MCLAPLPCFLDSRVSTFAQFAGSRRDAVDAPYARRETRPSLRTGSTERRNWKWKKKSDVSFSEASEKNSDSTGCVTAWKFEEGKPIMELMEDIVNVLERLERRGKGERREGDNGILV